MQTSWRRAKQRSSENKYYLVPIVIVLNKKNMNGLVRSAIRGVPLPIAAASMLLSFTTTHSQSSDKLQAAPPSRARTLDLRATWTAAGENNIYKGSAGTTNVLIQGNSGNNGVDIGNNYWGSGIDPIDPVSSPPSTYWPSFLFSASVAASSQSTISGISCSGGLIISKGGAQPTAEGDLDTCSNAMGLARSWGTDGFYDKAYDTMRYYILHCYPQADPYRTFNTFGGTTFNKNITKEGRQEMRNLLFQALHLRNDDPWFCLDVEFIGGTFEMDSESATLTVLKFLLENPRCSAFHDRFGAEYSHSRFVQFDSWRSSAPPNATFDSTLPTMHDLGLDSLLQFAASAVYETPGSQILLDAKLMPNPVMEDASLVLDIGREAYVYSELFDVVGNKVEQAGYSGVFEQGVRVVPLNLKGLSAGTYYLRVHTANNEARTLKLIKE
jgi:hypothetical protein